MALAFLVTFSVYFSRKDELQCCGVDGGSDFKNSPNFWKNDTYGGQTYTSKRFSYLL
ncbi:unnamed protein product [Schistosoma mattheei]|uniref:Uncharacterized protein n=1 Tax=Schistosoma mattheei TaxID=31246 RepID=A0A3P8J9Z8_9TREM|nr:unnamed protein product [Schistosoma mattheei]